MRAPRFSGPTHVSICVSFLLFATSLWAQNTIHVPADHSTIQAAIDAARDGDAVLVDPGTYAETINFNGKAITLASVAGPQSTIIDGSAQDSVVKFDHGEGNSSVLRGFTIRNGHSPFDGGGIYVRASSPIIEGNIITNNVATSGCGIWVYQGSPIIRNNTISNNVQTGSGGGGGGIYSFGTESQPASPVISGNVITNNNVDNGGDGGGIAVAYFGTPTIENNFIQGNIAFNHGGGIAIENYDSAIVVQNVIVGNSSQGGGSGAGIYILAQQGVPDYVTNNTIANNSAFDKTSGIFITGRPAATVISNNIVRASDGQNVLTCDTTWSTESAAFSNNVLHTASGQIAVGPCVLPADNLRADPQFVAAGSGDYHLKSASPAVDAGTSNTPNIPNQDIEGHTRITDGNGDCTNSIDIGAYEFQPSAPQAALNRSFLAFGDWGVGEQSIPMEVTVSNSGQSCVLATSIEVSGDFVQQNTCFAGLRSGQSCQVFVSFTPTESGLRTGSLTIGGNFDASPLTVALFGTGVRPVAVFAPDMLSFPSVPVGSTSPGQTLILSNTGAAELRISQIVVTGDFVQTDGCNGFLAPGASCGVEVRFKPTARGVRTGTLTIISNAASAPIVNLSGTGTAPIAEITPASLDFGEQKVGTSSTQTLTLRNVGDASLHIDAITTTGDFTYTENCFGGRGIGDSCTITVKFTPTAAGPRSGTLSIISDSFVPLPTVNLSGVGTLPAMEISPNSLSFGVVKVGTTSAAKTLTLSNSGNAILQIRQISVIGAEFAQSNGCGTELAAGSSCVINVTYSPATSVPHTGQLFVSSSDPINPSFVAANLSGVGGVGIASVSQPALQFPDQVVNTTSAAQPIIVTNLGSAELSVSGVSTSGDFASTNNCSVLAVGASCTINVVFRPSVTGLRTGSLTLNSDSAEPAPVVSLSGNGATGAPTLSTTSVSFGNQKVGRASQPETVSLTANGPGPLTIFSISATTEDFIVASNCPASLGVGSSCTVNISFAPIVAGPRSGFLNIATDAVGAPHLVSLSGTGKGGGKPN